MFAAVIVGIEMLNLIGLRQEELILILLVSLATAAVTARSFGLLSRYAWIPHLPSKGDRTRAKRKRSGRTVVAGPWTGTLETSAGLSPAEHAELDALLDKTSATGLDSLSKGEKARLNELSKKLRQR